MNGRPFTALLRHLVFAYAVAMPTPRRAFSFLELRNQVRPSGRLWIPAADVYRAEDGWIVKVDLAGVCPDELEMFLDDSDLIVRGCRRDSVYRDGYTYHQMEITYSRFEKRIQFPRSIDEESLVHEYRDGFLIIKVGCK